MLKLLFQVCFFMMLGALIYDFVLTGSFQKSQTYKYLKDYGAFDYGQVVLGHIKKSYDVTYKWSEKNVPVYYNSTCTFLRPYINLSYISLILKNMAVTFLDTFCVYVNKNFPTFQSYVSVMLADSLTIAKKCLIVISNHLQNYTSLTVQYASNMFE